MGEIIRIAADRLDGSEITSVPPHQVGLSEAVLAENIDPLDLRGAATRSGRVLYASGTNLGSAGNHVAGVKAWTRDNGTSFVLFRIVTSLWSANAASATIIHGPGWGTSGAVFQAKALGDYLILVVDGSTIQKYDGSSVTAVSGSPPSLAKYIAIFASKVFVAGDTANPQTKSFSGTNTPENWTAADDAGSITTQDGGGDTIRGLAANNKVLLTFYRNFTDALVGNSTFNFAEERLINRGLVSETGHAAAGEVVFFASDDAIYMVSGTTVSDITTARIRKSYTDISDKSQISLFVRGDKLYVIDFGSDRGYICAYKYGRWVEWSGQPWRSGDTANDQTLYVGTDGGSTTQVYQLDTNTTDAGAAITASWRTANFGWGWDDAPKNLRALRLHAKPGIATITVTWYKNGSSIGSTNTITFAAAGDHDWSGCLGQNAVRGTHIGFKASWSGPGTLYGWALYAEVSAVKGEIPLEA